MIKSPTVSELHVRGIAIKGIQGDYLAKIKNTQHPGLINKRKPGHLIMIGIDDNNDVYVYSNGSESFEEVKIKMSIQEASLHFVTLKRIDTDVKQYYLTKTNQNGTQNIT